MKALLLLLSFSSAVAQHEMSHHDHQTVESRGQTAMGFDQRQTRHRFLSTEQGGIIQVRARAAKDNASIQQIRRHLQKITRQFKAGDFTDPMFIHDRVPPGVPAMRRLKNEIEYLFRRLPEGAEVRISSRNPKAVSAVHEFFRMQIEDHETRDPLH